MTSAASHPPPAIGKSGNLTVFIPPPEEPESPGSEFSTPPTSPRAEDSLESESPPDTPTAPAPAPADPPPPPVGLLISFSTPPLVRTVSPPLPAERLSPTHTVRESPPLFKSVSAPLQAPELPSRPPPPVQVPPQLVRTVSPPLSAEKLSRTQSVQESPPLVISVSAPLQAPELASRPPPPPVQVPPPQFEKASSGPDGSALAFFWDAVARVQKAHASLDEHISRWFGLDQSKYQWALNDYYERTGQEKDSGKAGNHKKQSSEFQKV